jgi:F-type H+-transporting ATPase subunit b
MATPAPHAGTTAPGVREPFPPFNPATFGSQILWLAISFGLLYYLMAKVVLPKIGKVLDARRDRIFGDLEAARALKEQSETARLTYEKALADAKANASRLAQETRDALAAEVNSRRAAEEAKLAERLSAAEAEINAKRDTAMADVGAIATESAEAIVARLGGQASATDVAAAVSAAMKR